MYLAVLTDMLGDRNEKRLFSLQIVFFRWCGTCDLCFWQNGLAERLARVTLGSYANRDTVCLWKINPQVKLIELEEQIGKEIVCII